MVKFYVRFTKMSRIGKQPVIIKEGVEVTVVNDLVTVKGSKGELTQKIRPEIKVTIKDGSVIVAVEKETKESSAFWGLTRALISNMIVGVTEGYEKKLELIGVGYRVTSKGSGISLTLGFSHPVEFEAPKGIEIKVDDNKNIIIKGIDKQLVGLTAAKIRAFRKPEPYKGKGIRYAGEVVRRKPGKAGKV